MFSVYIIENSAGAHYTGQSKDVKSRLDMHNNLDANKARFHRTTYKKGPWKLIFKKDFISRREAIAFEKFLKTGKGREWLKRARLGG